MYVCKYVKICGRVQDVSFSLTHTKEPFNCTPWTKVHSVGRSVLWPWQRCRHLTTQTKFKSPRSFVI